MIQASNKQYEVVRTVSESDVNDVLVCKSLSGNDNKLYTLIVVKDKALRSRFLEIFSCDGIESWSGGFHGAAASESNLILLFDYNHENRLFYYKTLYWKSFADRIQTARNLLSELMSFNLPDELIYFMLEDENINLTSDGRIYFNYFMDLKSLPQNISNEDVVVKAASLVYRMLSDGLHTHPKELVLLKRKLSRRAFNSFASIYMTLRDMPDKLDADVSMMDRARKSILSRREKIKSILKVSLFVLMLVASIYYTVNEIRTRSVPAASGDNAVTEYKGLYKIGTVILNENGSISQDGNAGTIQQGE